MATTISDRVYTPDDLLRLPDGKRFELVDGQLVEQEMGVKESMVAWMLGTLIGAYALPRNLGRGFASDLGYRCFPFAPNLIRKPDGSFICQARLNESMLDDGFCALAPDLAFEVVSPSDAYREVEAKIDEYLQAGVRLIWIVNPERESVRVYRLDGTVSEVARGGVLSGEDVLPGFSTPVVPLFELPTGLSAGNAN